MSIDWTRMQAPEDRAAEALAAARRDALRALSTAVDAAAETLVDGVPEAERLSWTGKEIAARALWEGTASEAALLRFDREAAYTGDTRYGLASLIIARADRYRLLTATWAGIRRRAAAEIAAAKGPDEVRQIAQGWIARIAETLSED